MVLFETHQRFKGHFLNELHVSFKEKASEALRLLQLFGFDKSLKLSSPLNYLRSSTAQL